MRSGFLLPAGLMLLSSLAFGGPRWGAPGIVGLLTDTRLAEVSGLAASRQVEGALWAINDGGNGPFLHRLGPRAARQLSVRVAGAENVDWEDLASFQWRGKPYLAIADTGDNGGLRRESRILIVEEPTNVADGAVLPLAWVQRFRWPDGPRDCEAIAVDARRGEILLVSKKRVPPELFRLPLDPGAGATQVATRIGTLGGIRQPTTEDLLRNPVYGRYRSQISGADLSPNGRVLAVLNYRAVSLYTRDNNGAWETALANPETLAFPWLPQAEAIAFSSDGRSLLIASEQLPSPMLKFTLQP